MTKLTGLITVPALGLLTTSPAAVTDRPIVHRTWGLLQTLPSMRDQFYGPNFSYRQYMKARNWVDGIAKHLVLAFIGLVVVTPPLRYLAKRLVYAPGEGVDPEVAKKDRVEIRAVASPDLPGLVDKQAVARAWFDGGLYQCGFTCLNTVHSWPLSFV
jgi:hypothetical protein